MRPSPSVTRTQEAMKWRRSRMSSPVHEREAGASLEEVYVLEVDRERDDVTHLDLGGRLQLRRHGLPLHVSERVDLRPQRLEDLHGAGQVTLSVDGLAQVLGPDPQDELRGALEL